MPILTDLDHEPDHSTQTDQKCFGEGDGPKYQFRFQNPTHSHPRNYLHFLGIL